MPSACRVLYPGYELRNFASKPNMYDNVNQASRLGSAFGSIAPNLANLRLAK